MKCFVLQVKFSDVQDDGKIITVFTRSFQGSVLLFKYGQSMISECSLCNLDD